MARHLFVHRYHFAEMCEQAMWDFCDATSRLLNEVETTSTTGDVFLRRVRHRLCVASGPFPFLSGHNPISLVGILFRAPL